MAIFQRPFGQKNGNIMQASTGAEVTNDNPAIEDVGTGGIQWITERHVACVFLLDTSGSMVANDAIGKLNSISALIWPRFCNSLIIFLIICS